MSYPAHWPADTRERFEEIVVWAKSEGLTDLVDALEAGFLYGCTGGEVWGGLRAGLALIGGQHRNRAPGWVIEIVERYVLLSEAPQPNSTR